jgi:hypothetical protein
MAASWGGWPKAGIQGGRGKRERPANGWVTKSDFAQSFLKFLFSRKLSRPHRGFGMTLHAPYSHYARGDPGDKRSLRHIACNHSASRCDAPSCHSDASQYADIGPEPNVIREAYARTVDQELPPYREFQAVGLIGAASDKRAARADYHIAANFDEAVLGCEKDAGRADTDTIGDCDASAFGLEHRVICDHYVVPQNDGFRYLRRAGIQNAALAHDYSVTEANAVGMAQSNMASKLYSTATGGKKPRPKYLAQRETERPRDECKPSTELEVKRPANGTISDDDILIAPESRALASDMSMSVFRNSVLSFHREFLCI